MPICSSRCRRPSTPGASPDYERHDRAAGLVHRFRFVNDVPLNASNADVRVNFIEYWEMGEDKVQHFSWVTDLRVSKRNVYAPHAGWPGAVEDRK